MRIRRSPVIACLAAVALAGGAQAAPKVGEPAPDFTVTTFGGRTVTMAELRGDVIILNFWATWCAPCRRELPVLEGLFRSYNKYGFQVLAVATEDSVPESKLRPLAAEMRIPFIKKLKGPYRSLRGVPTNYIIDRSGKLVYAKAGEIDIEMFNKVVVPLLKEPMPPPTPNPPAPASEAAGAHSQPSAG